MACDFATNLVRPHARRPPEKGRTVLRKDAAQDFQLIRECHGGHFFELKRTGLPY